MRALLARMAARRAERHAARCATGKHHWAWIADRVYCNRCQIWR